MGEIEKKINDYFQVIEMNNSDFSNYQEEFNNPKKIAEIRLYIRKMIAHKIDYILTDSLADFIGYEHKLFNNLKDLSSKDIYTVIPILQKYLNSLFCDVYKESYAYWTYTRLIDKDLEDALKYASNRLLSYRDHPGNEYYGFYQLCSVIHTVFAFYLLNGRKDNIYQMCDIFLDNVEQTFDSLLVNNVGNIGGYSKIEADHRLIDYVLSKLDNRETREIK